MLRPERMSRVSVTGSKRYMDDVIEALYDLNLVDITDYDGAWDGFAPGDPIHGADEASDRLVTVRSLESILDVDDEDAGPTRIVTDDALEEELEETRQRVNELDDRREALADELRSVEEHIDAVAPFADVGIDLDLLSGYETVAVRVGLGDPEPIRSALADADGVESYQVFAGEKALAVFAYPGDPAVDDALVGAEFTGVEIPDAEGSPDEYLAELRHRKQQLESKLTTVEDELEEMKLEVAGFLLAAEEKLTIEVQKREVPLTFATTENAFVAEGWIPTGEFASLSTALDSSVGAHVDVEELERADYDEHGHAEHSEHVGSPSGTPGEAVADGGADVAMSGGEPPTIQSNTGPVKPFDVLTRVINLPKYYEIDPTVVLFLTFPLFFGFMIGDLGYGLLYMGLGYALYSRMDSPTVKSLGGIMLWAGGFTALFGILYGEIFGLHLVSEYVWNGTPPIEKGLSPATAEYAELWLVASLLIGLAHITIGYVFGFVNDLSHGLKDAVTENASWILLMFGVWVWIFAGASGNAPPILVGPESALATFTGFAGFSAATGTVGLVVAAVGLVLLLIGEGGIGLLESLNVLVNVLSYTRIAAVLLAKAGMAFVVNLLFFGVYVTHGEHGAEWHFGMGGMPEQAGVMFHGHEVTEIIFGGLVHGGLAAVVIGVVVLVVGHLLVLALGITSAGLQAVRLEYVEFFQKFYEGGGDEYQPFGFERRFTTED
jgi:V/A-type H+-transporting ATPase subunit I